MPTNDDALNTNNIFSSNFKLMIINNSKTTNKKDHMAIHYGASLIQMR